MRKMSGVKAKWVNETEKDIPIEIYVKLFVDSIGRTFGLLQFYAGLLGLLKKRKEEEG